MHRNFAFCFASHLCTGDLAPRVHGACILMRPACSSLAEPLKTDVGFGEILDGAACNYNVIGVIECPGPIFGADLRVHNTTWG